MAIVFIGNTSASGNSATLTVTRTCTAGNGLVALMAVASGRTLSSPTMSGETPVLIDVTFSAINSNIQLLYVSQLQTGGSKVLNVTVDASAAWSVQLAEFSGQHITAFYDNVFLTNTGTGSPGTVSPTTVTQDSMLMGQWGHNGNAGDTAGSGYTLLDLVDIGRDAGEYNVNTGAPGVKTFDATLAGPPSNWGIIVAGFKPAPAGGPAPAYFTQGLGARQVLRRRVA